MSKIAILTTPLLLLGCTSLPKNLPELADKSAERLDIENTTSVQALKSISADASITIKFLESCVTALSSINSTPLTDPEKKVIADTIKTLSSEVGSLRKIVATADGRAGSLDQVLAKTSDALRLIHGIVKKTNERELLVKQMIDKVSTANKTTTP